MPKELAIAPFAPRPIRFHGIRRTDGWRVKLYTIVYGTEPLDWPVWEHGIDRGLAALPRPAVATGRPGLGFVIAHRGCGADYVVVCWWDRENELPIRVLVREGDGWRPARGSESVCVWDLEVIAHERDVYVSTVLSTAPSAEAYLARALERSV